MPVAFALETKSHTQYGGVFMLCLHTEFHRPSSCSSLIIDIKLKAQKEFVRPPFCYFTFNRKKKYLKRIACFSEHNSGRGMCIEPPFFVLLCYINEN